MEKRTQERLSRLSPEERIARMQGLLKGIIRTDYSSTHSMKRFMNLFDVHVPTVREDEDYDAFLGQLDQPELYFTESAFDFIVASYDSLATSPRA